jgi:hypothetical protein
MKKAKKSVRQRPAMKALPRTEGFGVTALLEYLQSGALSELIVVEVSEGTYRLEALLTWRPGRTGLLSARGGPRTFRRLDTLVQFLKSLGVGQTVIRLELRK